MRRMSLLCAVKVDELPGYELLESVDFNGSQYILTDIDLRSPNYNVSVSYLDEGVANRMGSVFRIYTHDKILLALRQTPARTDGGNITHYVYSWWGATVTKTSRKAMPSNGVTCKPNEAILYFKDGTTESFTYTSSASAYPLYFVLGHSCRTDTDGLVHTWDTDFGWIGKIYSCQIKDASGTSILYDLVSVRQKSTNYIGMYDTINGKFYRRMDL